MPILDPSLQYQLLAKPPSKILDSSYNPISFYIRYINVASRHMFRNYSTIQTSKQFKKDIETQKNAIEREFNCKIDEAVFNNPTIIDYYEFFFSLIISSL